MSTTGHSRLASVVVDNAADLVVETDDVAPDRMRELALAASMLAEDRIIEYPSA